jgi:2-oxoglutarate/2-oxoacid ferredoxin oxidoreductase subunit beta
MKPARLYRQKYLRRVPSLFCPGCGNGMILNAFVRAVDDLPIPKENYVLVSGIGCSAWIPSPNILMDTFHTSHGRAVAFATGVKLANPKLTVCVISGDGDLCSIGGNHLLHAARNNVDLTVIMVNNAIYGMTGGQVGPTTPHGVKTSTTPFGNPTFPGDFSAIVTAAGASYVARWTTAHMIQLKDSIQKGIQKKGFSFIEVVSQCPSHVEDKKREDASEILQNFKTMSNDKTMRIGVFVDIDKKELAVSLYEQMGEQ